MKFIIIITSLAVVAMAARAYGSDWSHEVAIIRDDRNRDDYGRYSVDVEISNGIQFSDAGAPEGPDGAVVTSGHFSYTSPEGVPVHVTYVANENGFQPQSDLLPVAPAFPHPIPQFVLDQIAFAESQRSSEEYAPPSRYN